MKQLIVILLVVIAINQNVKAQLFLTQTPEHKRTTERCFVPSNDYVMENTQKTVTDKISKYKVTLTQIQQGVDCCYRFLYAPIAYDSVTTSGQENILYFDLPKEYSVTDINLFDSLFIFCGVLKQGDTIAPYIAYQTIDQLFLQTEVTFNLTPVVVDSLN